MNDFFRAYNYTLIYTSGITILSFIGFYATKLPITQASSIGILYGFLLGATINIIPAIFIFFKLKKPKQIDNKEEVIQKSTSSQKADNLYQESPDANKTESISTLKEIYFLANPELTYDILIDIINKLSFGNIINENQTKLLFSLKTEHQIIDFEIRPLTRHTTKINIKLQKSNDSSNNLISYIKQREYSLLNY